MHDFQKHNKEKHAPIAAKQVDTVQDVSYSLPRSACKAPPVNIDSGAGKAMPPCLAHVAVKAQLDTGATQKLSFANGDTALGTTVDLRFDTLTDKGEPFTI